MKEEYEKVSYEIIEKATKGDLESINQVLTHYEGYLLKQSLRPMRDEAFNQHMVIDEVLYGRMKNKLLHIILNFKIY